MSLDRLIGRDIYRLVTFVERRRGLRGQGRTAIVVSGPADYIGHPWLDRNGKPTAHPLHYMPTAEQDGHLSMVAFVSRGASAALRAQGVTTTTTGTVFDLGTISSTGASEIDNS